MKLMPPLEIGLFNGWIPLAFEFIIQGSLLLVFPKAVVSRLFDRSGWSVKQKAFTIAGKVFSLACLGLIILTPLSKLGSVEFILGSVFYAVGVTGLVIAMVNFKNTPCDIPVGKGVYRISRHPQIVSLFLVFLGISVAIGSWAAVFALVMSRLMQHFGILAEEKVCAERYGESYRAYMKKVPRYALFL